MKKNLSNIILILVFLIGLSLLLYPSVSDYWNSFRQTRAIASYTEAVADINQEEYEAMWGEAQAYNLELPRKNSRYIMTDAQRKQYQSLLNVSGNGIMGYIEIPSIKCYLPIYHGIDESILQVAIGHIEGTSLPVGGEGSHCGLSGHRGLPSAKLFTNLDKLVEGDVFMIRVLDEVLTYEVDQILIVLPNEMEALEIVEGQDYCTLVTCTPYGVNSHRLLVRGHRIDNLENAGIIRVTADALQIDPIIIAPLVAVPILLVLLVVLLVSNGKKHKK